MGKYIPKLPFGSLAFEVTVDLDKSKAKMFEESSAFSDSHLRQVAPIVGTGKHQRLLYLIPFFKENFTTQEAVGLLDSLGLGKGRLEDLLVLLRDHRDQLQSRGIKKIVEFGTVWKNGQGKENNVYTAFPYSTWKLYAGTIAAKWPEGNAYLLAVAEDGMRRKAHKTPRPGPSYPQPSTKPKTGKTDPLALERKRRSASIGVPGALRFKVVVNYGETAGQMQSAAGFNGSQQVGGLKVDEGRGAGQPLFARRKLILVPLSNLGSGDINTDKIQRYLAEHNLENAFVEDFLALFRDYREELKKLGLEEFTVQGTSSNGVHFWTSFRSDYGGRLRTNGYSDGYRNSFWVITTLKRRAH